MSWQSPAYMGVGPQNDAAHLGTGISKHTCTFRLVAAKGKELVAVCCLLRAVERSLANNQGCQRLCRLEGRTYQTSSCSLQKIHAQWACRPRWRKQSSSLYHVFVGGLASEVDDNMLFNAFLPYRCITARAIRDNNARRTKGYGFVEFE